MKLCVSFCTEYNSRLTLNSISKKLLHFYTSKTKNIKAMYDVFLFEYLVSIEQLGKHRLSCYNALRIAHKKIHVHVCRVFDFMLYLMLIKQSLWSHDPSLV